MPNIDPKVIFWISVVIAVCGVGSTPEFWTGALPADWIPMLAQWNAILSKAGQVVMPLLLGRGMTVQGRVDAAASIPTESKIEIAQSIPVADKIALAAAAPEVQKVVTTQAIAQAAGPDGIGAKIVSKP